MEKTMKKQITENIYGLIPMILVLFGLILLPGGCEKEDEYEDVLLENTKCPCEHEAAFIKPVSIKSILLFDSKVTSLNEMKAQTFDGEKSEFVAYSEEPKSMIFYSIRTTMTGICFVCNIPDKISDWTIPSTGIVITFKANEYELCIPLPGTNNTYSNCVLTSLQRKIK
jgi:hypothetical protein